MSRRRPSWRRPGRERWRGPMTRTRRSDATPRSGPPAHQPRTMAIRTAATATAGTPEPSASMRAGPSRRITIATRAASPMLDAHLGPARRRQRDAREPGPDREPDEQGHEDAERQRPDDLGQREGADPREEHGGPGGHRDQVQELEDDDEPDRERHIATRQLCRLEAERPGGRRPHDQQPQGVRGGDAKDPHERDDHQRHDDAVEHDEPYDQPADGGRPPCRGDHGPCRG